MKPRVLPLAALLASVVGCTAGDPVVEARGCADDADCDVQLVCALGTCADPDDPRLGTVDLAIVPPASTGYVTQQVFAVRPSGTGRVDVALRPTVLASGRVLDATGAPAVARVVVSVDASIAGRTPAQAVVSDGETGAYSLSLVDGVAYRVRVYPEDPGLPPLYLDDLLLADGGADGVVDVEDLELPDPSSLVVVTGIVQAGVGVEALGIPDLEVAVLWDDLQVSATARTDAQGTFSVAVAPGYEDALSLVVRPTPENSRFPTVVVDDLDLASPEIGVVDMGDVRTPVPLQGRVLLDDVPVASAAIHLRGLIGHGALALVVVAAEDGTFSTELPPGDYRASVVPPPGVEAGTAIGLTIPVAAGSPTQTLRLPRRLPSSGIVTSSDGEPVADATVSLARVDCDDAEPEPSLGAASWAFETATDLDGRFELALDEACYRMSVAPATGAGLPRHARVVDVREDALVLDVTLDPGALLAGAVVTPAGDPVPGAFVQAFSRVLPQDGVAFALGDGLTSGDGGFSIVVPDLLGTAAAGP